MSHSDPSPTSLTPETPLSPTQHSPLTPSTPSTPSSSNFPAIPTRNPSRSNNNNDDSASESLRPSQTEVTLEEALRQGPVTMPKNPRRLSEMEANLSRLERRKSKAWSGARCGIAEGFGDDGEGGEAGSRKSAGPLDAEEMKELLYGKVKRVSTVQVA